MQGLAEQLSAAGVAVFVADVRGGRLRPRGRRRGRRTGRETRRRAWCRVHTPTGFPVEYLALGGVGSGVPVRATVSDFGPQLLAKVLDANETQEQSLGLVFRYADEAERLLLGFRRVEPAFAAGRRRTPVARERPRRCPC